MNLLVVIQIVFLLFNSCDSKNKQTAESNTSVDCNKCNVENLRKLRFNKDTPEISAMVEFLLCCNKQCALNVEYSQASNYSMFILIQDYPDVFMNAVVTKIDSLDMPYIKSMLENPVSDDIFVNKTIEALKSSSVSSQYKSELLNSLKIASEK